MVFILNYYYFIFQKRLGENSNKTWQNIKLCTSFFILLKMIILRFIIIYNRAVFIWIFFLGWKVYHPCPLLSMRSTHWPTSSFLRWWDPISSMCKHRNQLSNRYSTKIIPTFEKLLVVLVCIYKYVYLKGKVLAPPNPNTRNGAISFGTKETHRCKCLLTHLIQPLIHSCRNKIPD